MAAQLPHWFWFPFFFHWSGVLFYDTCMIFTFSTRSITQLQLLLQFAKRFGKIRTANCALSSRNYRGLLQVFDVRQPQIYYISPIYTNLESWELSLRSLCLIFAQCSAWEMFCFACWWRIQRRSRSAPNGKSGFPFWQSNENLPATAAATARSFAVDRMCQGLRFASSGIGVWEPLLQQSGKLQTHHDHHRKFELFIFCCYLANIVSKLDDDWMAWEMDNFLVFIATGLFHKYYLYVSLIIVKSAGKPALP